MATQKQMLKDYNQLVANLKLANEHLQLANEMAARLGVQLFSEEETNKKKKGGLTEEQKARLIAMRRKTIANYTTY